MCLGSGSAVTFEDVVFEKCSLVVVDGAHSTLTRSQFREMAASTAGLSVCADGHGTKVAVNGGTISGGTQGMLVQAGASLQASEFNIIGISAPPSRTFRAHCPA